MMVLCKRVFRVDDVGSPLLVCRFKRVFALFIMGVATVFLWLSIEGLFLHMLIRADTWGLWIVMIFLGLLGLFCGYAGLKQFLHPMVMLVVTETGLVHHYRDKQSKAQTFFIPWERIKGFHYIKTTASSGGRSVLVRAVAVTLSMDQDWKIPDGANYFKPIDDDGATFYIDTVNPSPGGQRLLKLLEEFLEEYGSKARDVDRELG